MPFKQYIIEDKIECPQCHGDSQKRVEEQGDLLLIFHICKLCKYRKSLGVTTRRALEMQKKMNYYQERIKNARNDKEHSIFLVRLQRLEEIKRRLDVGIRR